MWYLQLPGIFCSLLKKYTIEFNLYRTVSFEKIYVSIACKHCIINLILIYNLLLISN